MDTISVDIKEQDLINFIIFSKNISANITTEGYKTMFKIYPFTLYRQRMMGDHIVTIQIPLENYCLFLGHELVK